MFAQPAHFCTSHICHCTTYRWSLHHLQMTLSFPEVFVPTTEVFAPPYEHFFNHPLMVLAPPTKGLSTAHLFHLGELWGQLQGSMALGLNTTVIQAAKYRQDMNQRVKGSKPETRFSATEVAEVVVSWCKVALWILTPVSWVWVSPFFIQPFWDIKCYLYHVLLLPYQWE